MPLLPLLVLLCAGAQVTRHDGSSLLSKSFANDWGAHVLWVCGMWRVVFQAIAGKYSPAESRRIVN